MFVCGGGCSEISLWLHLRVVELKTGDDTHWNIALFALKCCCFSPSPLLIAADRAVSLWLATRCRLLYLGREMTFSQSSKWLNLLVLWAMVMGA